MVCDPDASAEGDPVPEGTALCYFSDADATRLAGAAGVEHLLAPKGEDPQAVAAIGSLSPDKHVLVVAWHGYADPGDNGRAAFVAGDRLRLTAFGLLLIRRSKRGLPAEDTL